jgi:hypothetical protein
MSARNGDKAHHALNKRRVRARRVKIRELVKAKNPAGEGKATK